MIPYSSQAHATAFTNWMKNGSVMAQSASQPSPTVAPGTTATPEVAGEQLFTPMPQLKTYKALKDHPFGIEIATAQSIEEARLGPAGVDRLTQLGVRMD